MDRTSAASALVLAAVFLLSSLAAAPQPAAAQVGTSSLAGGVCSIDQDVTYIKAPEPGDTAGCGIRLPGATLRLGKAGVGGTVVGAVDKTATADGNGSYQFTGLADGSYTLAVARAGYAPANLTVTVQGATARDVGLHPLDIAVTGTVRDVATGAPLEGAHVTVCCAPFTGSSGGVTGKDGAFTVKTRSGERTFTVGKDGVALLSEARFVDGTQPVHLTVQPPPRPDAVVRGTVTDQDGRPLAGVDVNVHSYAPCCDEAPMPMPASSDPAESSGGGSSGVASPSYIRPCCYGGGAATATTDAEGRYSVRAHGGSTVSVSVYREGYASYSKSFQVETGEDRVLDIQLLKFPAKTAHVEGRVVDAGTGKGLPYVSISAQSPAYGLYECSQDSAAAQTQPATKEPAADSTTGSASSPTYTGTASASMVYPSPSPRPYDNGCAIRVNPDGTFSGNVTPGYTILQVSYDAYRACQPYENGAYRPCTPEYYTWTQSLRLPADQSTPLTVRLQQRPGPDAVVSGYLVDADTGKAIPGGQVSFSSQDGYGYGHATTDADGSYRIRIRSGHLDVHASAEGHLRWAGTLDVASGETPFDVQLTPGEDSNGGCCMIAYAAKDMAVGAPAAGSAGASSGTASATHGPQPSRLAESAGGAAFEDLHGGLGPYDATARSQALEEAGGRAAPAAGPLTLLALAGCALWLRRRA